MAADQPASPQTSTPYARIDDRISSFVLRRSTPRGWLIGFGIAFMLSLGLFGAIAYLFYTGVGIWGINIPVGWGFAITNFVWWVGIGHAGTLISAILLLFRQHWRTSINRFAEAMTLFAVAMAGLFPILHLGRPQYFYWLMPYPNTESMWPQFRSPLVWDLFAVLTYALVSLIFWFVGLVPDLAAVRDRAKSRFAQIVFGFLALGWRGSARHWQRYHQVYFWLAALATPLVISVHSIVALDFAYGIIPGWHGTLMPPYFVIGALLSGLAMVLTIAIPLRKFYHLEDLITDRHLDNIAKFILAMSLLITLSYATEIFMAWYSGNQFEEFLVQNRALGPYAPLYWLMISCNVIMPLALIFKRVRQRPLFLFIIALLVNVGMWTERFVIVVVSLSADFLPSSWGIFVPTVWDIVMLFGSVGLFAALIFLFIRFLPVISISEVQEEAAQSAEGA